MLQGLTAPETVPEGSTGPIEVRAADSSSITVSYGTAGEEFEVPVVDGVARFELPPGVLSGESLLIFDTDNLDKNTGILITPAS